MVRIVIIHTILERRSNIFQANFLILIRKDLSFKVAILPLVRQLWLKFYSLFNCFLMQRGVWEAKYANTHNSSIKPTKILTPRG